MLIQILRDPMVDQFNLDGSDRFVAHGKMLARKKMMREVFAEFHRLFDRLDKTFFSAQGLRIELGAGVSPIRDTFPDVLATDVVASSHLDCALNAEAMALSDHSVRAVFCQNSFHHFPHPQKFFHELERVLPSGGGAVILDPYYGPAASFLYKRLFPSEGFDTEFPSWDTPATGPMSGANQALSYVVFTRDRREFENLFPNLEIVRHELCGNYLRYLFSGGLNFRQMCPDWATPLFNGLEWLLTPMNRWLALHHVIVLRKK